MTLRIIGHPDLEGQVRDVFAADPKRAPVAVARIRALLESFDEDPLELEPRPVANEHWSEGIALDAQRNHEAIRKVEAAVAIYIYEAWALRFAIAQVRFPPNTVVGAWLMVETQAAASAGLTSHNLSLALLGKVQELIWPV